MPNLTIENIDLGGVILEGHADTDGTLQNDDADDPVTLPAGTILARHATDLKYYPFDPAGSDGLNAAKAVLTYDVTIAANSGLAVRVLTKGVVNKGRLSIADGTTITEAHLDQLRDYGIDPQAVKQLSRYDNPQT